VIDDSARPGVLERWGLADALGRGRSFGEAGEAAFRQEVAETNRRRLMLFLPMMIALHVVHMAVFHPSAVERATLSAQVLTWRNGVVAAHGITLLAAVLLFAYALLTRKQPAWRWLATAVSLVYIAHAVVIVGVDQLTLTTMTPYVGYMLGISIVVCLEPPSLLTVGAIGVTSMIAALFVSQHDPNARQAMMPNAVTTTFVSMMLGLLLHGARRRDFRQRATIQEQGAALSALNAQLEQRVREQVAEIVVRAEQVEQLNAQLQARVRERSVELSKALATLAERGGGGALPLGSIVGERFKIVGRIGSGGMGDVYEGLDSSTGGRVAIKVVQARSAGQLDSLGRFLREARAAAAVNHPAVVRMLHVDVTDEGMFFQVQELVTGESLHTLLGGAMGCDPAVAARVGAVLCEALAAAHACGVVHRDIKPGNILLTPAAPGLKLVDFGVSKLDDDPSPSTDATQTGMVLGTPAFMSPEQLVGSKDITDRSDIYAVGVTLYRLLTGRYPFRDVSIVGMVHNHQAGVPDVRTVQPDVPAEIAELVNRCVSPDPAARPSAAELAAALHAFADRHDPRPLDALVRAGVIRQLLTAEVQMMPTLPSPMPSRSSQS
jgi:hypothetical protein